MISDTVSLMMLISAFIATIMLISILFFFKSTYFEDVDKSFEYPLFDSPEDLQASIDIENKMKNEK